MPSELKFRKQSYINIHKPDVIVVNETWLKADILNSEILPNKDYILFRLDRSKVTHPPDPNNPKKSKLNGGGVLIATSNLLDLKPKILKLNTKSEILSITLTLKGSKKLCITICYRVGTLGHSNLYEIVKHLQQISINKSIKNLVVIGDFNLDSIDWQQKQSTDAIHNSFLELFDNHCLTQLINEPKHYKGNIRDLLLIDTPQIYSNLNICEHNEYVKSDHFAIKFDIDVPNAIKRIKPKKRIVYNYKKANWEGMNTYLNATDWSSHVDSHDIYTGWDNFKTILKTACDMFIPTTVLRDRSNLPWFDAELHKLCIQKERSRLRYEFSQNPEHYEKFSVVRKNLKDLMKKKMRANVNDPSNPNAVTKKFRSFVKSNSNSVRIPVQVHRNSIHANNDQKRAELFNAYFYDQFSESSTYQTDIDCLSGTLFEIDFNTYSIMNMLKSIDINKSSGPDGIEGVVLKNCALALSYPLSILFKISYVSGQLPTNWKMANVDQYIKKAINPTFKITALYL